MDAQLSSALSAQISDMMDGRQLLESSQRRLKHLRQSIVEIDRLCGETGFLIERYDLISSLSTARRASFPFPRNASHHLRRSAQRHASPHSHALPCRNQPDSPSGPHKPRVCRQQSDDDSGPAEGGSGDARGARSGRRRRRALQGAPACAAALAHSDCLSPDRGVDAVACGPPRDPLLGSVDSCPSQVHEQLCALEAKCAEAKRVQKIDDSIPWRRGANPFFSSPFYPSKLVLTQPNL